MTTELEIIMLAEIEKRQAEEKKQKSLQEIRKEKKRAFVAEAMEKLKFLTNYGFHPYLHNGDIHIPYDGYELRMVAWFKDNGELSNKFATNWNSNICHNHNYPDMTLEEIVKKLACYIKK